MINKKALIWSGVVATVLILLALVFYMGLYPIASADGSLIYRSQYDENKAVIYNYYKNYYNEMVPPDQRIPDEELADFSNKASITSLIDKVLIKKEIINEIGEEDYEKRMKEYVDSAISDSDFMSQLREILNVKDGSIDKYFVSENARFQVLNDVIPPEDDSQGADWMAELRDNADVKVFYPGMMWDGRNGVIDKTESNPETE